MAKSETEKAGESRCRHQWVIDSPAGGPISKGVCKECGEERDFYTSFTEEALSKRARRRGREAEHDA